MKTELQVSDIAMYLPYGLTFLDTQGEVKELDTISMDSVNVKGRTRTYGMYCAVSDIKPRLRPMVDLNKEDTLMDLKWIFSGLISYDDQKREFIIEIEGGEYEDDVSISAMPYKAAQYLIENLFDINDLIGQGLAVDINTVEK